MTASRFTIFGALAATLLMVPACDDKKADAKSEAKTEDKAKPEGKDDAKTGDQKAEDKAAVDGGNADPEAAKPAEIEGGAEAAADTAIGVPVCDEYLAKYAACINEHGPEDSRKQLNELIAKSAQRFKTQSEGPEKDSLEQACKAMLDAAKKTTKDWGCTYE